MTATEPGIHLDMPADEYHSDPCPEPSLSHSIARTLVTRSAQHAWHAHPKLNPKWIPSSPTPEMQDGTVLHAMVLGGWEKLVVSVDADDWRLNATKLIRNKAIAEGKIPILSHRMPKLIACAKACRTALEEHDDCANVLTDFDPEATLIWRDGPVWCRSRVDVLPRNPLAYVYDFKFTTMSSAPLDFEKSVWKRHGTQAVFYCRGLEILRGVAPPGMRFVACETEPPFGVAIYELTADAIAYAADQVETALRIWAASMGSRQWRGYSKRVQFVELPGWVLHQMEAAQSMQQVAARARPSMSRVAAVQEIADRFGEEHGGPLS